MFYNTTKVSLILVINLHQWLSIALQVAKKNNNYNKQLQDKPDNGVFLFLDDLLVVCEEDGVIGLGSVTVGDNAFSPGPHRL